jgi:chitinase
MATGANHWGWDYVDLPSVQSSLDLVDLMAYDLDSSGSSTSNFLAPLYQATLDPSATSNIDYAVKYYLGQGVPAAKLILGMPFYSVGWSGVEKTDNGLFQAGTFLQNGGNRSQIETLENKAGYTLYRDATTQEPWLYNSTTGDFWSFDDPTSLAFKTQYMINNKLGGVMFWDLSSDDSNATLLKAITAQMQD